jgi:serine/threonine protein kinase
MTAPLLPALPGYSDPELIAHGTTALVFRAMQTRLNRPVAIKVITAETVEGAVPLNVERELATTVALSSQPHIVSIIDTGVTADDRRYIVMEYCEGGSYAQILRQKGPLPVDDVVDVGIKIGQALHAAHVVGIVHRDVKPSNILRSRFGPALTDFGIARAPDELGSTLTREMMTPHHASPEALLHQAQSGLSDVYSLASTMWTLLVGHPPFVDPARPDMDMYSFRDRVLHDPLPPMERGDVPDWLDAELRRAMAKLPEQRHQSALGFSQALQRGSLGLPSEGPPGAEPPRGNAPSVATDAVATPAAVPAPRPPGFEPAPIYRPTPTSAPPAHTAPALVATREWPQTDVVSSHPRPRRDWAVPAPRPSQGRGWLIAVVAVLLLVSATSGVLAFVFAQSPGTGAPPTNPTQPSSPAVTATTDTPSPSTSIETSITG